MSIFMIETDSVSSVGSELSSLASTMENIASSVGSYDTSCEDGFDFSGAKSVIMGNVEACSTKISNTSSILDCVVTSHTQLQNSLEFTDPFAPKNPVGGTGGNGGYSYGGGTGGYSGYGGYSSSGGGAAVSTITSIDPNEAIQPGQEYDEDGNYVNGDGIKIHKAETMVDKILDLAGITRALVDGSTLSDVNYVFINKDKLQGDALDLFEDKSFEYDSETGYAMFGGRYVITCDESIGKVGDVVLFTQEDGSVIECIVGVNTTSEKYKDVVNFVVDKSSWDSHDPLELTENLLDNNTRVENLGNYKDVDEKLTAFEETVKDLEGSSSEQDYEVNQILSEEPPANLEPSSEMPSASQEIASNEGEHSSDLGSTESASLSSLDPTSTEVPPTSVEEKSSGGVMLTLSRLMSMYRSNQDSSDDDTVLVEV